MNLLNIFRYIYPTVDGDEPTTEEEVIVAVASPSSPDSSTPELTTDEISSLSLAFQNNVNGCFFLLRKDSFLNVFFSFTDMVDDWFGNYYYRRPVARISFMAENLNQK